ncbi:MAG: hypothetical protein Q9159_001431 [Coniocarpon cinnabarinum]
MAPTSSSLRGRHLGLTSWLALAGLLPLVRAQSVAECVSTPGVNLQLLSACESLRGQITLTPGATVALSTEVQLTPTSSTNGDGIVTSNPSSTIAQTNAVGSTGGLGGASQSSGAGSGESTSNGVLGGSGSSRPSTTAPGVGGFGGSSSSLRSPTPVSFASQPTNSSNGFDSSVAAGSAGGSSTSGANNGEPTSASGGSGAMTGTSDGAAASTTANGGSSSTAGAAGAQDSNAAGLTQSGQNSDPHHYRNTVVIPAAVVGAVVPILLLALLACCLIRRRRKKKASESALLANAENEKFRDTQTTNGASAFAGAAPLAGGAAGASHARDHNNPFADPVDPSRANVAGPGGSGPHFGAGSGAAAGLGAGALAGAAGAGIASHDRSRRDPSAGPRSSTSSARLPAGVRPSGISPAYTAYGASSSIPPASSGAETTPHYESHIPSAAPVNPARDAPSSSHHGLGVGTAAGLGAAAGAAEIAGHEHTHEPSTPSNYSSATSQQNIFGGFSGANTPLASSPSPPSNNTPRGSTLAPTAAGLGGAGLGAGALAHQHRKGVANTPSSVRSDRPPTLPPMDSSMGSGVWLSGQYDDDGNMPRDPASFDYGEPSMTTQASAGPLRVRNQSPPANFSRPAVGGRDGATDAAPATAVAGGVEDPFRTPARSVRQSYDAAVPEVPQRSSQRTPPLSSQSQFRDMEPHSVPTQNTQPPLQASHSPVPATATSSRYPSQTQDESFSSSHNSGLDPRVDRASPPPRGDFNQPTDNNTQGGFWQPPAVGQIIEGPFRGSAYQPPQIGAEDWSTNGSSRESTGPSDSLQGRQAQGEQFTRVPSPDEVRSFDFGNGDGNGGNRESFGVRRKPVGGGF